MLGLSLVRMVLDWFWSVMMVASIFSMPLNRLKSVVEMLDIWSGFLYSNDT